MFFRLLCFFVLVSGVAQSSLYGQEEREPTGQNKIVSMKYVESYLTKQREGYHFLGELGDGKFSQSILKRRELLFAGHMDPELRTHLTQFRFQAFILWSS